MPYDLKELFYELIGQDGGFEELLKRRPLLAHYTNIGTAEKILKDEKIWMSNPLFMNDLEELRYGIRLGTNLLSESHAEVLAACSTPERKKIVEDTFLHYLTELETKHALDIYVFCLSEIHPDDNDGSLPMWRSYANEGNGAAIVFNTASIIDSEDKAPLIIGKVSYVTKGEREDIIKQTIKRFCDRITLSTFSDTELQHYTILLFKTIEVLALLQKHKGFSHEDEWRAIYLKDETDIASNHANMEFGYYIGTHGIQPKLIFHLAPEPDESWTFSTIIEKVILGPSVSTSLAKHSFMRMLECIKKPELKEKVITSTIPLRPQTFVS